MHLNRQSHGRKDPAVVPVATHPAVIEIKSVMIHEDSYATNHLISSPVRRSFATNFSVITYKIFIIFE